MFVEDNTYPASDAEETDDGQLYDTEEKKKEKERLKTVDKKGEYRSVLSSLTACTYEDNFERLTEEQHQSLLQQLSDVRKVCTKIQTFKAVDIKISVHLFNALMLLMTNIT